MSFEVEEHEEGSLVQEPRGSPGDATHYRRTTCTCCSPRWKVDTGLVAYDAKSDGCFPLVTNDASAPDAEALAVYKHQPHLERRHAPRKGVPLDARVFSKDTTRIEGLLCCRFVALLVQALVERRCRGRKAVR